MLDVNTDIIGRLIALARDFQSREQVVVSEEPGGPADEWPDNVPARFTDNSTLDEFRSIVADLEPRQQQQVVALLWIGRGDYDIGDWDLVLQQARDQWTETTADYLISHPLLADHLIEGLDMHGHRCD